MVNDVSRVVSRFIMIGSVLLDDCCSTAFYLPVPTTARCYLPLPHSSQYINVTARVAARRVYLRSAFTAPHIHTVVFALG